MKKDQKVNDNEIDRIVEEQAGNESAWEDPIAVRKSQPASIFIPPDLAARATFLSRLHRSKNVEEWLNRIIQERIEIEEAAFVGVKQKLAENG